MAVPAYVEQGYAFDRRSAPRRTLRLEVPAATAGARFASVRVHDVSRTGFLIEALTDLAIDEELALDLPEAEQAMARVIWRSGQYYGCRFDQPISNGALSASRLRGDIARPAGSEPTKTLGRLTDAMAEVKALEARVRQLRQSIHSKIDELVTASVASNEPREDGSEEADDRFSFATRLRVILFVSLGSWALILWAVGIL